MSRVKTPRKSESVDEWLDQQGYYRKPTAKDGSCLFRAVSEQVFNTQAYHLRVRNSCVQFMERHREDFEEFVDVFFDHYLANLQHPKEWAGHLEMSAMSVMYKKDFIVFQDQDKQQYQTTDNNFKHKILLYFSDGNHYDSVFPKNFVENAAVCQSIIYNILYERVFELGPEVDFAVEKMLHDKEYAKHRKDSATSQDGIYDKSSSPSPDFLLEQNELEFDEKEDGDGSQIRRALAKGFPPFPYKIAKALDADIYRNVELDVWNEQRKGDGEPQFEPGVKCLVRIDKDRIEPYHAHVQEIFGNDKKTVTVYIEELAKRLTVGIEALEPLPVVPQKIHQWLYPLKTFKPSIGYYPRAVQKSPMIDYDQFKGKKKTKKKLPIKNEPSVFSVPSTYPARTHFETPLVAYSRGRASPPVMSINKSPSPRLKWTQQGQQNQNNYSRYRSKNNNLGGRFSSQSNIHSPQPSVDQVENAHKVVSDKDLFDFQDQDLSAFPALPKTQGANLSNSSHVSGVWGRNNSANHTHHTAQLTGNNRQLTPTIPTAAETNGCSGEMRKPMPKDLTPNYMTPHTSTPPIPIQPISSHEPSKTTTVFLSSFAQYPFAGPQQLSSSPPLEFSSSPPTAPCTLSSPLISQEVNAQLGGPMTMPPPPAHTQGMTLLNAHAQQTPQPPPQMQSSYGYVPFQQMYPGAMMPFSEGPAQSINFNVGRSQDINGNDLPLNDLPTLRFFYNLGHDYFRMSSMFPPVQQQQPFTVWNYGTPITYSPVNSFTPPPLIGPDSNDALDETSCSTNGQCQQQPPSRFGDPIPDHEFSSESYDGFPDYTSMYVASIPGLKNGINFDGISPKMPYPMSGYHSFEMTPPPPLLSPPMLPSFNGAWTANNDSNVDFHTCRQRSTSHRATLPPRFQRRGSNSRKDRNHYEGQPLLRNSVSSTMGSELPSSTTPDYGYGSPFDGLDADSCGNSSPGSLTGASSSNCSVNGIGDNNFARSSLGYYHPPGSPTSTPTMLATPPTAVYYSHAAPYVYHQPPPPLPQQMPFLPAAVQ